MYCFLYSLLVMLIFISLSCSKDISVSPEDSEPINGRLVIDSDPRGAEIYLNGKNTGDITPDTISWLNKNTYKITLKKEHFKDTSIVVNLPVGDIKSVFLNYNGNTTMNGGLYIETNFMNADIFINDSATGKIAPGYVKDLFPGEYKVTIKRSGCWSETFTAMVESVRNNFYYIKLTDTTNWIIYNQKYTGIQSEHLTSVAVEKRYIKWIGTSDSGVIRYDDNEWKVFNTTNSPLPSNIVNRVYVDHLNRKWFCTNQGLAMFNDFNWTIYNTSNSGLPENYITAIGVQNSGTLWVGTNGGGLASLNNTGWTIFTPEDGLFPSLLVNCIFIDENDEVWIGTKGGGLVYINYLNQRQVLNTSNTKKWGTIRPGSGFPSNNITSIAQRDSIKWIGFGSYKGSTGGSAYKLYYYWRNLQNLPSPEVLTLCGEDPGILWFGTFDEGLTRYKGGVWENFDTHNSPMPSQIVNCITLDANNDKWIATLGGGLVKYKNH